MIYITSQFTLGMLEQHHNSYDLLVDRIPKEEALAYIKAAECRIQWVELCHAIADDLNIPQTLEPSPIPIKLSDGDIMIVAHYRGPRINPGFRHAGTFTYYRMEVAKND